MEKAIAELTACFNRALNAYDQLLREKDNQLSACKSRAYGLERQTSELQGEVNSLKALLKKLEGEKAN